MIGHELYLVRGAPGGKLIHSPVFIHRWRSCQEFESVEPPRVESMFEDFADADDGAIVAAIEESARVEAAAGARRMAAIAELVARRVEPDGDERWYWACDSWDSAAAEVAAALNIGHRAASGLMHQALALRDRVPLGAEIGAPARP